MNLNKLAIDTISSDYIKEYLYKIKHEFTIEEQLTIIFNSELSLDKKFDLYDEYIKNIKDRDILNKLDIVIHNTASVLQMINGEYDKYILLHTNDWETLAYRSLSSFVSANRDKSDIKLTLDICDLDTSKIVARVYLNEDYIPNYYDITDDSNLTESGLEDTYVKVPNDIDTGDTVKINGDCSDTEYVVIGDSHIPEELIGNCCYTVDATISVIPKEVIPKDDRTYKDIIESIIKNRIYYIGDSKYDDVLVKHEDHMHITFAEKVLL